MVVILHCFCIVLDLCIIITVHTGFGKFCKLKIFFSRTCKVLEVFFFWQAGYGKVLIFFGYCQPAPTLKRSTVSVLIYMKVQMVPINYCNINRKIVLEIVVERLWKSFGNVFGIFLQLNLYKPCFCEVNISFLIFTRR